VRDSNPLPGAAASASLPGPRKEAGRAGIPAILILDESPESGKSDSQVWREQDLAITRIDKTRNLCRLFSAMKCALVAGTRPEVIKLAPLAKAMERWKIPYGWVLVRQHQELLDIAKHDFGVSGQEINLDTAESLAEKLGSMLSKLEDTLADYSHIIVQGDTLTAFAGALVGFLCEKKVIHIEAGVRSHNLFEPFPEEQIRMFIDRVAWLRFAPTKHTLRNLKSEGLLAGTICSYGNTVSDALFSTKVPVVQLPFPEGSYFLVSLLRRENWSIIPKVYEMLSKEKDRLFIVVVHPNHSHEASKLTGSHIVKMGPLLYPFFIALLRNAAAVITDSGGTQEEAALLGVPAFILRRAIDRPESIEAGQAKQVANYEELFKIIDESDLKEMAKQSIVYGDGRVSERIALQLARKLGLLKRQ
jgi:UDP-N-acetylglucosamine 2-epimerase (non-hydrolysing)